MKYCSNKDMNKIIRQLVRDGWKFKHGSKHGRLTDPSGLRVLTVAKTPGDHRTIKNFRSDLRSVDRWRVM